MGLELAESPLLSTLVVSYEVKPLDHRERRLQVVTHIRGHIRSGRFSLLTSVRALRFNREKILISALFSLVDSRRVVPTRARRSQQQLILFLFLQINSKSHHGGIRTLGPTLTTINSSIRG